MQRINKIICRLFGHRYEWVFETLYGGLKCKRCGNDMFDDVLMAAAFLEYLRSHRLVFYEGNKPIKAGDCLVYNEYGNVEKAIK